MIVAKVVAQLFLPLNLALELWLVALLLRWRGRRRLARGAAVAGLAVLLVAAMPPVARVLARGLESEHPPVAVEASPTADAIVVLGGIVGPAIAPRLAPDLSGSADRLLHGARLFRAGKAPVLVAAGGSVRDDMPPESPDMADLLVEWGVPREAVLLESASRTTRQNAEETWRLLEPRGAKRILLVTSALHMPRAVRAFRRIGFVVEPAPTDFQVVGEDGGWVLGLLPDAGALDLTTRVMHEWMGSVWYALRGW